MNRNHSYVPKTWEASERAAAQQKAAADSVSRTDLAVEGSEDWIMILRVTYAVPKELIDKVMATLRRLTSTAGRHSMRPTFVKHMTSEMG